MSWQRTLAGWFWKILISGVAYAVGAVAAGALVSALGLELPQLPMGANEGQQMALLVAGGMAMAVALAAMAIGLAGSRWQRWVVLVAFVTIVSGVGNALEGSIFTTLGGQWSAMLVNVLAGAFCASAVTLFFPAPTEASLGERVAAFRERLRGRGLAGRLALAILTFPSLYFFFGMTIVPIVKPYYDQLEYLTIPPMATMLGVLVLRSAMFLVVSLLVIVAWHASRMRLVVGLGLGHFAAVGFVGLVQATFLPAVLRWTHGVEILADSMFYALVLVWLLLPRKQGREKSAVGSAASSAGDAATGAGESRRLMMSAKELGALALKIVLLTLILTVVNGIGSRFLPAAGEAADRLEAAGVGAETQQPSGSFLALVLLVMLLQVLALAYPVIRSRWAGWKLAATVFILYFGTVTFMSQIESLIYLGARMPDGMLPGLFLMGLFTAAVFSPIAVMVLGRWKADPKAAGETTRPLPWRSWAWRSALGAAVYLALYYLFGYFVAWKNPAVREFYGGTDPGSFFAQMSSIVRETPWMLPFQFVRGLLWVSLAVLVIRMMKGRWWEAGLAVSVLFTVPALYLLFPNPIMPDAVRMAHLVETAPYQFLFGWIVVWLLLGTRGQRSLLGDEERRAVGR